MADTKDEIINGLDHFIARRTATPSAAESPHQQAIRLSKAVTAEMHLPPDLAVHYESGYYRGYMVGHAAGEVAGAERERARVCVWTESHDENGIAYRSACGSLYREVQAVYHPRSDEWRYEGVAFNLPRCPFCGGRIEVKP